MKNLYVFFFTFAKFEEENERLIEEERIRREQEDLRLQKEKEERGKKHYICAAQQRSYSLC